VPVTGRSAFSLIQQFDGLVVVVIIVVIIIVIIVIIVVVAVTIIVSIGVSVAVGIGVAVDVSITVDVGVIAIIIVGIDIICVVAIVVVGIVIVKISRRRHSDTQGNDGSIRLDTAFHLYHVPDPEGTILDDRYIHFDTLSIDDPLVAVDALNHTCENNLRCKRSTRTHTTAGGACASATCTEQEDKQSQSHRKDLDFFHFSPRKIFGYTPIVVFSTKKLRAGKRNVRQNKIQS
jgi:hypothetical protein